MRPWSSGQSGAEYGADVNAQSGAAWRCTLGGAVRTYGGFEEVFNIRADVNAKIRFEDSTALRVVSSRGLVQYSTAIEPWYCT
jgi:hypothetical protein